MNYRGGQMNFNFKWIIPALITTAVYYGGSNHVNSRLADLGPEPVDIVIRTDIIGLESTLEALGGKINYSDNGLINLTIRRDSFKKFESYGAEFADEPAALSASRGTFPSYNQVLSAMDDIVLGGGDLVSLDTLGNTAQGRPVVQLTIGNDNESTCNKPIISITGATHGNEKIGSESVITLAQELVDQYGVSESITSVVDRYLIKIIPVLNADGYSAHERFIPTSYNDPNREFGWQVGYNNGPDNHSVVSYPFGDKAVKLYRNSLIEDPWYISMDYHTGVEAVITPWFADEPLNPVDISEYSAIGNGFVNQFPGLDRGLQFGGWMEQKGIPGVQSDYPYIKAGTMALTMEVHNSQSSSKPWDLDEVCRNNIDGFIAVAESAYRGISGIVVDQDSLPLYGHITFDDASAHVYSSPKGGAFYKNVQSFESEREVSVFANGYLKKSFSLPVSSTFEPEMILMERAPEQPYGALSIEYLRSYNRPLQSDFYNCLELRDEKGLPIESYQSESFILLDMGKSTPARDREGDDITVYLTQNGTYKLYGSNDIDDLDENSAQNLLGHGEADKSFDIASVGADSLRYFKIVVPAGSHIGLDAIEAEPAAEPVAVKSLSSAGRKKRLHLALNEKSVRITGHMAAGSYSVRIFDLRGKLCSEKISGNISENGIMNTSINKPQGAGFYIVKVQSQFGKSQSFPLMLL